MAEDCIRWEPTPDGGVHTPRAGFKIVKQPFPRVSWSLFWSGTLVCRFALRREAQHCAEDILRIRYGLASREDVESRYGIDLGWFLDEPPATRKEDTDAD